MFTLFSSSYPSSSLNVEDNYNTMASITNQKDSQWYILTMDLLMISLLRGIDKGTWGSGRFAWSWFNQSRKQSNYLPLQSRQIKLHPTRFFSWPGYSSFHKNSNRYSCMRNEQWLFYEIFSVFGQIKNLWTDKIASKTSTPNSGKLRC